MKDIAHEGGTMFSRIKSLGKQLARDGVVNSTVGLVVGTVTQLGFMAAEYAAEGTITWTAVPSSWLALVIGMAVIAAVLRGFNRMGRDLDGI